MTNITISIFGSKIFLEILNEIKLFAEYKTKYYEDLDLCIKDSEKKNSLAILFVKKEELNFFDDSATDSFPLLLINQFSSPKSLFLGDLTDQLNTPFTIFEFKKKIVSLIAKNKFKKNSLIKLNNYIIYILLILLILIVYTFIYLVYKLFLNFIWIFGSYY